MRRFLLRNSTGLLALAALLTGAALPAAGAEKNAASDKTSGAESATQKVVLGDPELTTGIPGEGKLTTEQIKTWISDPRNHQVLEVELPLGLDRGRGQMHIPEDNPMTRAKIELGRQLYFDPRLSADATISCASCHHPDSGYAFNSQFGIGIDGQQGGRNSPVSYNRIFSEAQFWDGRAASVEEQAKGPIANPIEMGNTHEACVACIEGIPGYQVQFEKVFPGEGITIDSIAKAIATFERAIVTGPAPYDYWQVVQSFEQQFGEEIEYLEEDDPELWQEYLTAKKGGEGMSESAVRGQELFFNKAQCTACHVGANFTDEKYHNLGVGMDAENPDLGRYEVTGEEKDKGAFKTPTVRNVEFTAPYMHDGSQDTLMEVVEWYDKGGHKNPWLSDDVKPLKLTEQEKKDLVAFMKALSGPFPQVETGRLPDWPPEQASE